MIRLAGAVLFLFVSSGFGAEYDGPRPPKPDVPYLLHAGKLVETEAVEAKEEPGKKDDVTYAIDGASSPAKTPLAEPVFIFESDKISPERLELYRLEVRNGRREITINQKRRKGPRQYRVLVTRLSDRLYRVEASQSLEEGEYSLSPSDSNRAFCFQVY
jgi:hypothetical protein